MKNPYSNIPYAIWLLAAVTLISKSGSVVLIFLPLYLTQSLNFDIIVAGQIVSLYGLGQIAGAYAGGSFIDKFGSLTVQSAGFFLVGMLYLMLGFLSAKSMLMSCMFFVGLFTASIRPATGATIVSVCTSDRRAQAYSLNYQAENLGFAIGPSVGGILANISYMWIFRLDGLVSILSAIALWVFFKALPQKNTLNRSQESADTQPLSNVWQDWYFLAFLLLVCLTGICFFQLLSIYPLYLSDHYKLSISQIGMIMAFNGALIILFQMQVTKFFKKFDAMSVIGTGGMLICAGYFILPWYTGFCYALLSMSIITFGEMLMMPFAFEVITNISPAASRGKYLGLLSCALSSIPLFVTPNLIPYIYSTFGPEMLWFCEGIIGVIILTGFQALNKSHFGLKLNAVAS
jgi:MFS family permease